MTGRARRGLRESDRLRIGRAGRRPNRTSPRDFLAVASPLPFDVPRRFVDRELFQSLTRTRRMPAGLVRRGVVPARGR